MNSIRSISKVLSIVLLVSLSAGAMAPEAPKQPWYKRAYNSASSFVASHPKTVTAVAGTVAAASYADVRNPVVNGVVSGAKVVAPVISTAAKTVASKVAKVTKDNAQALVGAGLGAASTAVALKHAEIKSGATKAFKKAKDATVTQREYVAAHPVKTGAIAAAAVAGSTAAGVYGYKYRSTIWNGVKAGLNATVNNRVTNWLWNHVPSKQAVAAKIPAVPASVKNVSVTSSLKDWGSKGLGWMKNHKALIAVPAVAAAIYYQVPQKAYGLVANGASKVRGYFSKSKEEAKPVLKLAVK